MEDQKNKAENSDVVKFEQTHDVSSGENKTTDGNRSNMNNSGESGDTGRSIRSELVTTGAVTKEETVEINLTSGRETGYNKSTLVDKDNTDNCKDETPGINFDITSSADKQRSESLNIVVNMDNQDKTQSIKTVESSKSETGKTEDTHTKESGLQQNIQSDESTKVLCHGDLAKNDNSQSEPDAKLDGTKPEEDEATYDKEKELQGDIDIKDGSTVVLVQEKQLDKNDNTQTERDANLDGRNVEEGKTTENKESRLQWDVQNRSCEVSEEKTSVKNDNVQTERDGTLDVRKSEDSETTANKEKRLQEDGQTEVSKVSTQKVSDEQKGLKDTTATVQHFEEMYKKSNGDEEASVMKPTEDSVVVKDRSKTAKLHQSSENLDDSIKAEGSVMDSVTMDDVKEVDMDSPLPEITGMVSKPQEMPQPSSLNDNNDDLEVNKDCVVKKKVSPEIVKVRTGLCPFDELPPLPKKVVRIFVSSTFTDTKEERNALMQYVYPKLSDYCRERHGLDFQIVDMRWGVPEQASDNHTTSELCIQEIKKCQEVSVGPNFMAIVGDKYGYRPVPRSVEEGLFQTLTSSEVDGWQLVEEWYKKDTNAVPAIYILQPISSKIQHYNNLENAELRYEAWNQWNRENQQLSIALRAAADRAYERKRINSADKQLFYMSVTENEITTGVIEGSNDPSESCYCVIRKISDVDRHLDEGRAPRFLDMDQTKTRDTEAKTLLDDLRESKLRRHIPEANLTALDIEWSVSGACMSIEKCQDVQVLKFAQRFFKEKKMGLLKHKEYLDSLCNDVFVKLHRLIEEGTHKQTEMYDDLTTEILQHFHLAKMRCDVFEGREDILCEIQKYLSQQDTSCPYVVYGKSGCGKTSVMAKVFESASNQAYTNHCNSCFTVIARFLGTSTKTSNVHQLLVSMCMQLSAIFETPWKEPEQFTELVKSFYRLLENATSTKPVLLILDSVDQLMPIYNAYKLFWLPDEFPPNVKLIASTIDEGYNILDAFREKYESIGLKTTVVNPLGEKLGLEIITRWLKKDGRQVTESQRSIVQEVLTKCSLPLYARIVYDHVRKWKSFDVPAVEQLETTIKGAINKLFQQMEEKFGKHPVQHCLAYLTNSRYGLSETELEHILSLDDLLLNKIFKLWNPPVRRIPALIWTRIRADIHSYIVERSADDQLVLYWYHRQFIQTTKERYLADSEFANHINEILIDYFSGKWGSGKEKPFLYTDSQMKRFGFEKAESKADRKVPSQPYWIEHTVPGNSETRYNKRKLSELPYHLLRNKDFEELKEQVFFSFKWLYAKMKSTSVQQMIEEIDIFMRADKILKKDAEMKLMYANLQLIRPYILVYPDSLSYELSGRLAKYIGKYKHITDLIQQCDIMGRNYCPLIPLTTCFETASLGFQQNLNFRSKEPWHQGGTFTSSPDFRTLYVLDYNEEGLPLISSWDVDRGEKINEVLIDKVKTDEHKFTTDLYFQAECTKGGKELLGFYKQRMDATYQKIVKSGCGLIDVIDLETGKVKSTYDTFLYRDEFFNPLFYLTDNFMCVAHGWKMPLINYTEDKCHSYNRPTLMSRNEKFFIMCGKDKTVLRLFETKQVVAEFETPEYQISVTASDDFSVIAMMGAETKDISIFDLSNKVDKLSEKSVQFLKSRVVFNLDGKTVELVSSVFKPILETLENGRIQEKTNNRVIMQISPDKRHLMVVFVGWKWMAFLWKTVGKYSARFVGKYSAKFVGPITPHQMQCSSRYPMFSYDSIALIYTLRRRKILIVSTDTLEVTNEYMMKEDIKDICISKVSNKVAVMLQKSIMLLNVVREDEEVTKGKCKPGMTQLTEVLLPREIIKGVVHSEIIQRNINDITELQEIGDISTAANTDRIASARSRSKEAVAKYYTPDGYRVLHLHKKAQVIDTVQQDIIYTPKPGDTIARSFTANDGTVVNENVAIPDMSSKFHSGNRLADSSMEKMDRAMKFSGKNMERENIKGELLKPILSEKNLANTINLRQGDRIVNENNRIKFRMTTETEGQIEVMVVPSVITVYAVEDLKLKKLQRITVYHEVVLDISNSYMATSKTNTLGHFVKVYEQASAKSLAVHEMAFACECARFSSEQEHLFVVDRSLTVKQMLGPQFTGVLRKFSLMDQELSAAFVVKDIMLFEINESAVLVSYGPEGPGEFVTNRYIFYDFTSNKKSKEMNVSRRLEDVSCDGKFGVDTSLTVYVLETGIVFSQIAMNRQQIDFGGVIERRIRYTDAAMANERRARISDDNKYLVYINANEGTLHVVGIGRNQLKPLTSCYMHAQAILADHGFSLRHHGTVLLLKTGKNIMPMALAQDKNRGYSYESEYERARSIVASTTWKSFPKVEKVKLPSVFEQRKLFMQQEDSVKQKEMSKNLDKYSSKPSVLVLGEPVLCSNIFNSDWFSPNLNTQKMSVQNVDDAFEKLKADSATYDVMILQLITEDVTMYDVPVCVKKVSVIIELARQKARIVVLSYAPLRADSKELSDKITEVNDKLGAIYVSSCGEGRQLHICKNSNLSEGGKQVARFFKDGVQLSPAGLKKISENFKHVLAPLLGLHHI